MAAELRAPRGGFPPKVPGPDRDGRAPTARLTTARLTGARLPVARLPGARPDPPSEPVPDGRAETPSRGAPVFEPPRPKPLDVAVDPRDPPATPPREPAAPDPRDPPPTPSRGPAGASLVTPRDVPPDAPPRPGAPRVLPVLGARSGRCPPRFMTTTILGAVQAGPRLRGRQNPARCHHVHAHSGRFHAQSALGALKAGRPDPRCARKRSICAWKQLRCA